MLDQQKNRMYESWRQTERMMKVTRDPVMRVSLPKLRCLGEDAETESSSADEKELI